MIEFREQRSLRSYRSAGVMRFTALSPKQPPVALPRPSDFPPLRLVLSASTVSPLVPRSLAFRPSCTCRPAGRRAVLALCASTAVSARYEAAPLASRARTSQPSAALCHRRPGSESLHRVSFGFSFARNESALVFRSHRIGHVRFFIWTRRSSLFTSNLASEGERREVCRGCTVSSPCPSPVSFPKADRLLNFSESFRTIFIYG